MPSLMQATSRDCRRNLSFMELGRRKVLSLELTLRFNYALFLKRANHRSIDRLGIQHVCSFNWVDLFVLVNHQNRFKDRIGSSTVNGAQLAIIVQIERKIDCLRRVSIKLFHPLDTYFVHPENS
ncbi:unnamed protein product [Polarella glacialis]|uniref:Uncharacterized protein n=1 Tax=Polarella glacialis TaxID=89957 RepID=A0A813HZR2_POLGL|nr:unnamed protein product [Polarella glacialis]CAE8643726.1 unnamed protein product [Polarella glacialis]